MTNERSSQTDTSTNIGDQLLTAGSIFMKQGRVLQEKAILEGDIKAYDMWSLLARDETYTEAFEAYYDECARYDGVDVTVSLLAGARHPSALKIVRGALAGRRPIDGKVAHIGPTVAFDLGPVLHLRTEKYERSIALLGPDYEPRVSLQLGGQALRSVT